MKRPWIILVSFALVAVACTGGSSTSTSTSPSGSIGSEPIHLVMWMGYTPPPPINQSQEYLFLKSLADKFHEQHPNIDIELRYVNNDNALKQLTVALAGNEQPDISYQYGTNMPQVASASSKLVDLTSRVSSPDYNWNDFFPGDRAAATVNGKVLGVPALVDNLAVVYNPALFTKAGVPTPSADWTWSDLQAAAKAVADPANKVWGLAFPADGTEATVWEYEPMLWEAGGDILTPDNTKAAFNSAAGVRALTVLSQMNQEGSLYLDFHPDASKSEDLFNAGKIGMIITAPWDLTSFPNVSYRIQFMPSFDPGGSHTTIAGPDNWVIFDNGADHVNASWQFVSFITSPENIRDEALATSHLPTRSSVWNAPGFSDEFDRKYPGQATFAENLSNLTKGRPQIPQYPAVSSALGIAIVDALLGQQTPQDALNAAATQADAALAIPT